MSEEVLGIIKVNRPAFGQLIRENLYVTPDRVVVARTSGGKGVMFGAIGAVFDERKRAKKEKECLEVSLESVLTADKNNFAVYNSEITEVELKKGWLKAVKLNITTTSTGKQPLYKWNVMGLLPKKKKVKLEDYENILRPAFGDKLSVKK